MTLVGFTIDLHGSRLGPEWHSVRVTADMPPDWTGDRMREEAAKHYGVPVVQVGIPVAPFDEQGSLTAAPSAPTQSPEIGPVEDDGC